MAEKISRKNNIKWVQTINSDNNIEFFPLPSLYALKGDPNPPLNLINIQNALVESSSYALSSSFAQTAQTASFFSGSILNAISSSYALSASFASTASFVQNASTASFVVSSSYALSASFAQTASFVASSSYALSASFAQTASFASTASFVASSSYALSSSFASTASFSVSSSYALSASNAQTASFVQNAVSSSYALSASNAQTASFVASSSYALSASNAQTASFALSSSYALSASNAQTASFVQNAISSSFSRTSSFAQTASFVLSSSYALSASFATTASNTILQQTITSNATAGGSTSGAIYQSGSSIESILRAILITYIAPTIGTFTLYNGGTSILSSNTVVEVSSSYTFNTASFAAVADSPNGRFAYSASFTASGASTGNFNYFFGNNVLTSSNNLGLGGSQTVNNSTNSTVTFTLRGVNPETNAIISQTRTATYVYPYYYGMSLTDFSTTGNVSASLTQLTQAFTSPKTLSISGTSAYVYFCYPSSYADLSSIKDGNGFEIFSAFTKYTRNQDGPPGKWAGISYKIYRSNTLTSVSPAQNYVFTSP